MNRRYPHNLENYPATYRSVIQELIKNKIQPVVLAGGQERYFAKVSSGLSLHVLPTDGTNTMPMMDTAARSGFVRLVDGYSGDEEAQIERVRLAWTTSSDRRGIYTKSVCFGNDGTQFDYLKLDTDDGNIAYAQVIQVVNCLNYVSDGSKWVRMTQP